MHRTILRSEERALQVPDETGKVPLELRVKGWLEDDRAIIGPEVTVRTRIDRKHSGRLLSINPAFIHAFG